MIPVTNELLADSLGIRDVIDDRVQAMWRRHLYPWEFPDPPAIRWTFDPFPRLHIPRRLRRTPKGSHHGR